METIRVLVVDDEADFRETMINRLTKRNITAHGAESGEQALESIKTDFYDVIILDLKMKGMDGITTLQAIKKDKPLIEVILLTGHGSLESGIEGMKRGAFDYLQKPAYFDLLIEKIRQACGKKGLPDEKIRQTLAGI